MKHSWRKLMNLTGNRPFRIRRVEIEETGIAIEGDFAPPPLAALSMDDQIFAAAFLASHGSIKKMETLFGISYPTVKNRLNHITSRLDVPRVEFHDTEQTVRELRREILNRLDSGKISFRQAMEALENRK